MSGRTIDTGHNHRTCPHVACRGIVPDSKRVRIIPPVDSERCLAAVFYGDEQCCLTRLSRGSYCDHHTREGLAD